MKKLIVMHRRWVAVIGFFIALAAVLSLFQGAVDDKHPLVIESAGGQTHAFGVEVAATPQAQAQGLMGRTQMADDEGMIFLFGQPPRIASFWMKNTLIPLDMIFIKADGRIGHIHANARPHDLTSIPSQVPVVAVIEINGGLAAKLGIAEGDQVVFESLAP